MAPPSAPPGPGERWTPLRLMLWSARYLEERGVVPGRLDAEHLLAHALGLRRLDLYLQHERPLQAEELAVFKPLLLRRAAREPLQYILGRTPFRELDLATDHRALVPRPETEVLVEVVLEWAQRRAPCEAPSAADIGTGSGCIALSLVREGPFSRVVATDLSPDALELARENARRMDPEVAGRVEFRYGSLLEPLAGERFDLLVSNPPYVREGERAELAPEISDFEPALALFAGADGLAVIRPLVEGAERHLGPGGLLALEVGAGQAAEVSALVERTAAFETPVVRRDLAGRARIVTALRR